MMDQSQQTLQIESTLGQDYFFLEPHESTLFQLDCESDFYSLIDDAIELFHEDRETWSKNELNDVADNFVDPFHDDWPYW